jgi:hypothetical protein
VVVKNVFTTLSLGQLVVEMFFKNFPDIEPEDDNCNISQNVGKPPTFNVLYA